MVYELIIKNPLNIIFALKLILMILSCHKFPHAVTMWHVQTRDGLEHDCNISIANALEIMQSCTKPLI